uniref:PDEase domain-containing protein n=1 Tax=Chromera velia CCMP2878 TaxID=1169474 RepID=A0A0G4GEP1_9ALVE|eukprot:Cvel_21537.t1-p1 / transcript=Cvel_21537.t1 / gene=Cvel_21537 / organism=Chromera_velia_CCMP2878 / gene_product=Calcium/calmodulin-dependent 3',5'-cyclic, putative / transcript_product=Calcium/calmodulin-dependent 3',5'-cyclic, putative / location=Cvel_scaffold2029:13254-26074(+) / protein_length=1326 / sequence_SO=supercontig / SO=protein_coding / is_pseudo=false
MKYVRGTPPTRRRSPASYLPINQSTLVFTSEALERQFQRSCRKNLPGAVRVFSNLGSTVLPIFTLMEIFLLFGTSSVPYLAPALPSFHFVCIFLSAAFRHALFRVVGTNQVVAKATTRNVGPAFAVLVSVSVVINANWMRIWFERLVLGIKTVKGHPLANLSGMLGATILLFTFAVKMQARFHQIPMIALGFRVLTDVLGAFLSPYPFFEPATMAGGGKEDRIVAWSVWTFTTAMLCVASFAATITARGAESNARIFCYFSPEQTEKRKAEGDAKGGNVGSPTEKEALRRENELFTKIAQTKFDVVMQRLEVLRKRYEHNTEVTDLMETAATFLRSGPKSLYQVDFGGDASAEGEDPGAAEMRRFVQFSVASTPARFRQKEKVGLTREDLMKLGRKMGSGPSPSSKTPGKRGVGSGGRQQGRSGTAGSSSPGGISEGGDSGKSGSQSKSKSWLGGIGAKDLKAFEDPPVCGAKAAARRDAKGLFGAGGGAIGPGGLSLGGSLNSKGMRNLRASLTAAALDADEGRDAGRGIEHVPKFGGGGKSGVSNPPSPLIAPLQRDEEKERSREAAPEPLPFSTAKTVGALLPATGRRSSDLASSPTVGQWDLDILKIRRRSDFRPLSSVVAALDVRHRETFESLGVDSVKMREFAVEIEKLYQRENPYHNEINGKSDLALRYNDKSVLESYHAATCYEVMLRNEGALDLFGHLPLSEWQYCRRVVIDLILETDMQVKQLQMNALVAEEAPIEMGWGKTAEDWADLTSRDKMLKMFMKLSDLGHAAKPWPLHGQWSRFINAEFINQGRKEIELGLPISPLCDESKANLEKDQVGFLTYIVLPMLSAVSDVLKNESFDNQVLHEAKTNMAKWDMAAKDVAERKEIEKALEEERQKELERSKEKERIREKEKEKEKGSSAEVGEAVSLESPQDEAVEDEEEFFSPSHHGGAKSVRSAPADVGPDNHSASPHSIPPSPGASEGGALTRRESPKDDKQMGEILPTAKRRGSAAVTLGGPLSLEGMQKEKDKEGGRFTRSSRKDRRNSQKFKTVPAGMFLPLVKPPEMEVYTNPLSALADRVDEHIIHPEQQAQAGDTTGYLSPLQATSFSGEGAGLGLVEFGVDAEPYQASTPSPSAHPPVGAGVSSVQNHAHPASHVFAALDRMLAEMGRRSTTNKAPSGVPATPQVPFSLCASSRTESISVVASPTSTNRRSILSSTSPCPRGSADVSVEPRPMHERMLAITAAAAAAAASAAASAGRQTQQPPGEGEGRGDNAERGGQGRGKEELKVSHRPDDEREQEGAGAAKPPQDSSEPPGDSEKGGGENPRSSLHHSRRE